MIAGYSWIVWLLIVLQIIGMIGTVARIGKPRKPLTAGDAAGVIAISSIVIVGLLIVGQGPLS